MGAVYRDSLFAFVMIIPLSDGTYPMGFVVFVEKSRTCIVEVEGKQSGALSFDLAFKRTLEVHFRFRFGLHGEFVG
jgi:hypothetical protein